MQIVYARSIRFFFKNNSWKCEQSQTRVFYKIKINFNISKKKQDFFSGESIFLF